MAIAAPRQPPATAIAAAYRAAPPAPLVVLAAVAAATGTATPLAAAAGRALSAVASSASAPAVTAALIPTNSFRPAFPRRFMSRTAPVVAATNTGMLPNQRFTGGT